MEKRVENIRNIVVTGPESTGKTELVRFLASRLDCQWVPEYARRYVEELKNTYSYSDIERIAKKQIEDYHRYTSEQDRVIFDTWLIITKVWFQQVYDNYPGWIEENLRKLRVDFYLICSTDLEWKPDPVRENGGARREELFNIYLNEIKKTEVPYGIVNGHGNERFWNALKLLNLNNQEFNASE
jgi:nicotinamide riboside kinase